MVRNSDAFQDSFAVCGIHIAAVGRRTVEWTGVNTACAADTQEQRQAVASCDSSMWQL